MTINLSNAKRVPGIMALLLAFFSCTLIVPAQIAVTMTTPKKEVINYEPIRVTIDVTNQSGAPILLATADEGSSWIRFDATNERGDLLPLIGKIKPIPPIQLRPGQSTQHTIDLGTMFPLSDFGTYKFQANVWCPPDRAYTPSNTQRVNVVGASEIWSSNFAVPAGKEGAGTSRIFRLLRYRGMDDTLLYVRLDDRSSGMVLRCFSIGNILELREPTCEIDAEGRLNVLQLISPTSSFHTIIDSSGNVVGRQAYKEEKNERVVLNKSADGGLAVTGGRIYDPALEQLNRLSERKTSDRPAGLSQLIDPAAPPPSTDPDTNYQPLTPPPGR